MAQTASPDAAAPAAPRARDGLAGWQLDELDTLLRRGWSITLRLASDDRIEAIAHRKTLSKRENDAAGAAVTAADHDRYDVALARYRRDATGSRGPGMPARAP